MAETPVRAIGSVWVTPNGMVYRLVSTKYNRFATDGARTETYEVTHRPDGFEGKIHIRNYLPSSALLVWAPVPGLGPDDRGDVWAAGYSAGWDDGVKDATEDEPPARTPNPYRSES